MKVRRVVHREVTGDGAAVNVAAAVTSGEGSSSTRVRSRQRVVQRSGKSRVETERVVQSESEGRGE